MEPYILQREEKKLKGKTIWDKKKVKSNTEVEIQSTEINQNEVTRYH